MVDRVEGVSTPDARIVEPRPPADATWFHAHGQVWVPFSEVDTSALEAAWDEYGPALQANAARRAASEPLGDTESGVYAWLPSSLRFARPSASESVLPPAPPPPLPNPRKTPLTNRRLDPDESKESAQYRVPVLEDRLFDVDLETMVLFPALWPGFDQQVLRATWFYVSTDAVCSPIAYGSALSDDLDRVYEEGKPWDLTDRLRAKLSTSKAKGEMPPTYPLPSVAGGARVLFDSAYSARVYTYVV